MKISVGAGSRRRRRMFCPGTGRAWPPEVSLGSAADLGRDLAERLIDHLRDAVEELEAGRGTGERPQPVFHH